MTIAYFPFTGIPEELADAAYRRIGRFCVYAPVRGHEPRPLRLLADEKRIELRCPVTGEEALIMKLCRSFQNWGAVHQGRAAGLKQFAESGFYNDEFAAEIRSEILKGGGDPSRQSPDPMLNARVFLQLSQEFDMQEAEIEQRLATTELATRHLFDELRGEGYDPAQSSEIPGGLAEDTGAFMTEARMAAWCQLVGRDAHVPEAFLTHSPAVLELLSERFPALVRAGTCTSALGGGGKDNRIVEQISRMSAAAWEGTERMQAAFATPGEVSDDGFQMEIHVVPNLSPAGLIRSFIDPDETGPAPADVRHSFICLMASRK